MHVYPHSTHLHFPFEHLWAGLVSQVIYLSLPPPPACSPPLSDTTLVETLWVVKTEKAERGGERSLVCSSPISVSWMKEWLGRDG